MKSRVFLALLLGLVPRPARAAGGVAQTDPLSAALQAASGIAAASANPTPFQLIHDDYNPFARDHSRWLAELRAQCRPLNWAGIAALPARVIYLGEYHYDRRIKHALAANMGTFHAGGITDFGYEGFQEPMQPYLDGRPLDRGLMTAITKDWKANIDEKEEILSDVLSLVPPAASQGIRLHRLDMSSAEKHRQMDLCDQHNSDIPRDPDGVGCEVSDMSARDQRMARNIAQALDAPQHRMVALVGALHAEIPLQPQDLAKYRPGNSMSLLVLSSDFVAQELKAPNPNHYLMSMIDQAQPGTSDLYCPLPPETALYDGVIVLRNERP